MSQRDRSQAVNRERPSGGRVIASRRSFLLSATGVIVVPLALSRCGPSGEPPRRRPMARDERPDSKPTPDARAELPGREPEVRVRVQLARENPGAVTLGRDGEWLRIRQPDEAPFDSMLRGPVEVRHGTRGWVVTDNGGYRASVGGTAPIEIRPAGQAGAGETEPLTLNNHAYPGWFRIVSRTDEAPGGFDVINHVGMEAYLPGVIASELYNHWHDETHAAQAIAARSFAWSEHAFYRARRHFDLTNTQASQVYAGTVTHRRSLDMVARTRGVFLAYDGAVVTGYYSSCCGGLAARAVDAISENPINDVRPLHGRAEEDVCTEAPVARWRITRPREELIGRIRAFGAARNEKEMAGLRGIERIEVAAVNQHGRPTQYLLTHRRDEVSINAERLRFAANFAGGGGRGENGSGPALRRPERVLRSSHFTAQVRGDEVRFDGRGFGHGVGMCQHGAEILAQRGERHGRILEWYYPGAFLAKSYG